ncbi:hypothetical protein K9E39_01315 [Gardnerella vaginalis]|nr:MULTISPECIES: hypothetical protein [Actinomycetes]NMX20025.1 hypothetical protein [Mobiluncus mulieris]UQA78946.1 hypothetical protein K9E45_01650 [Gardnerella vaginalis]UQA79513.1 hypothetical protein K9E44_04995 [Gardnerella vaginalis]UQA81213.1 hypothetical protein K9E43_01275 [Gardnerella piotii]UQA82388.1 hypothetical protein K9E42_01195 [Gardnerella vaginalis]
MEQAESALQQQDETKAQTATTVAKAERKNRSELKEQLVSAALAGRIFQS